MENKHPNRDYPYQQSSFSGSDSHSSHGTGSGHGRTGSDNRANTGPVYNEQRWNDPENPYHGGGYGISGQQDRYRHQQVQHRPGYNDAGEWIGAPEAFQGNRDFYRGGIGFMGGGDYRIAEDRSYGNGRDEHRSGRGSGGNRDWWDRTKDEVSSWFGGDETRDRHQPSPGLHRGKGPRGYQRSSERIREDVCERLADDAYVDASDIEVRVEGTEVVVSGTVHSREEKRRVEDLIDSISGVTHVQNQLRVNRSAESSNDSRRDRW